MGKDIRKTAEFNLVEVIVIILITGIIVSVASGLIVFKNYDKLSTVTESSSNLVEFNKAYEHIVDSYVKDVDKEKLIDAAIDGMYTYLNDEYSIYIDKDSSESLEQRLDGEYSGVGIEISANKDNGKIIISNVFSDSPAMEAGLKIGDELIALDGVSLSGKETTYVSDTIKNSKKKTFKIKYKRNNNEYEVELTRKVVTIDSVISKDYHNVGYIQIQTFSATTCKQVKEKIKGFGDNIDSVVIDLRNNTGGYLSAAYQIADYFVQKGKPIYQLKDKNNKVTKYNAKSNVLKDFKGISVLINNYSASASEVLTLALKESANATIVGTKSYGKGTVQETDNLSSGAMVKYTTAYWLSPNGNSINGIGISPDIEVKDIDKQLDTAVNLFRK